MPTLIALSGFLLIVIAMALYLVIVLDGPEHQGGGR